jgi:hypothetical protein
MSPQEIAAREAGNFVGKLNTVILFPTIALLGGIAFFIFLYGCAVYIFNSGNETARTEGKKHITYGIIGLLIMVSAYGLLNIATNTFGLGQQLDCANDPFASGCSNAFKLK